MQSYTWMAGLFFAIKKYSRIHEWYECFMLQTISTLVTTAFPLKWFIFLSNCAWPFNTQVEYFLLSLHNLNGRHICRSGTQGTFSGLITCIRTVPPFIWAHDALRRIGLVGITSLYSNYSDHSSDDSTKSQASEQTGLWSSQQYSRPFSHRIPATTISMQHRVFNSTSYNVEVTVRTDIDITFHHTTFTVLLWISGKWTPFSTPLKQHSCQQLSPLTHFVFTDGGRAPQVCVKKLGYHWFI